MTTNTDKDTHTRAHTHGHAHGHAHTDTHKLNSFDASAKTGMRQTGDICD